MLRQSVSQFQVYLKFIHLAFGADSLRAAIPESLNAQAIANYRWLLEEWRIHRIPVLIGAFAKH